MAANDKYCIYCGSTNPETNDHIPPRGLFAKPRPATLISVPCCFECNNNSSNDDEYFRNTMAFRKEAHDHPDVQGILPTIFRGLSNPKKTKFKNSFLNSIEEIEVKTKAGIYLGKKASYHVDKERLCNVAERIVRGLFWKDNGSTIPSSWTIKSYLIEEWILSNRAAMEKIARLFMDRKGRQIGNGVFRYWIAKHDKKEGEVWWLTFYHATNFMIILRDSGHELAPPNK
jgi:hypothetical protein